MILFTTESLSTNAVELTKNVDDWGKQLIDGVVSCGFSLLQAILTAVIGWFVIKLIIRWSKKLLSKTSLEDSIANFIIAIVNAGLKILLVISLIGIMGVPMSSIIAVIGSAGLAIGLALQGCLTNLAGGVLILIVKPFKVGDYIIEAGGFEGTVTAIDIIYTKLLTADNRAVTIPNGTLANSTVINVTKEKIRRLDFSVSVGYHEDIDKTKQVLLEAANKSPYILKDKECAVFVNNFDPSRISMILRFWVDSDHYWTAKWETQEDIKRAFDDNHIEIPYEQLDIHINQ